MLVYLLAIASGSGSLALFLTAFFLPEIHKKGDFLWSGLGLFYALVLWITASKIGGGLLLGETAGVAVLVWAILQILQTRWKLIPLEQRSAPSVELVAKIEKLISEESLQKLQTQVTELAAKIQLPTMPKPATPVVPPKAEVVVSKEVEKVEEVGSDRESIPETSPSSPSVEVPKTELGQVAGISDFGDQVSPGQVPTTNPESSNYSPDTTTVNPPEITQNNDENSKGDES